MEAWIAIQEMIGNSVPRQMCFKSLVNRGWGGGGGTKFKGNKEI